MTAPKHSADRPDLAQIMADTASDREQILAQLADAEPVKHAVSTRWTVVRQYSNKPDETVSTHRFEWVAYWRARRRVWRHAGVTGVHFTVRRADA